MKTKLKPVMRKVVSSSETKFENVRRSANTINIDFRKSIVHTLECGHRIEVVGHVGIQPKTRMKCPRCTSAPAVRS